MMQSPPVSRQHSHHRAGCGATWPACSGRRTIVVGLLVWWVGIALSCAGIDVPPPGAVPDDPTPQLVNEFAVGLLIGNRAGKAESDGYVSVLGVLGRESYIYDPAVPGWRGKILEGSLDGGDPAGGGNFWVLPYRTIKNGYTLLPMIDKVAGVSEGEKNVLRGFTKTIIAHEFLTLVNTRYNTPIPIDMDREVNDELAPCVDKEAVFDRIEELLDEACRDLGQCADLGSCASPDANPGPREASAEFPFSLGAGFAGLDSTAGFARFNRGLRARVAVYREDWQCALDMVEQSFISMDANALDAGAYWTYSTDAGEVANGLISSAFTHPSVIAGARPGDDRLARKTEAVEPPPAVPDPLIYTADHQFTLYSSPSAPVPILRNEELILIRAEANIGLERYGAALDDINFIRENSGNLAPLAELPAPGALAELLYNRRYSLLFEGGHRWIDMRRYGRLNDLLLDDEPQLQGELVVHDTFPIPDDEADARAEPCGPG